MIVKIVIVFFQPRGNTVAVNAALKLDLQILESPSQPVDSRSGDQFLCSATEV